MKGLRKILLHRLPPAVAEAVSEQLDPAEWEVADESPDCIYDIVLTGDAEARFPGAPVLALKPGKPLRLGTLLRQMQQALSEPVLYLDDIPLDGYIFRPQEKILLDEAGAEIALTDREADMLAYLARHRGKPVSRDDLLKNVWAYQDGVDTHTLETHIYRLRQKTGAADILVTDAGGYRLKMEP